MTHLIALIMFLSIYVALEFIAGFLDMDSAHLIAVMALYLACRSDLRLDQKEDRT